MSLSNNQKQVVDAASRSAIHDAFGRLLRHARKGRWVGINNRYVRSAVKIIQRDSRPPRTINSLHLAEYIAASGPIHCMDGWSLLAGALDANARGDGDAARHFAYYAELRAAMSLLAAEGVGIFSDQHFVADGSGACQRLPQNLGTHKAAWFILEYWAGLTRAVDLLTSLVEPVGISVGQWLDAFGVRLRPVAANWLRSWGLDLSRLTNDRDARNEASYRPSSLLTRAPVRPPHSFAFVRSLWTVCEPSIPRRFENIDRHLLRLSLEKGYTATFRSTPTTNAADYRGRIVAALGRLGLRNGQMDNWVAFLTRASSPDTPILLQQAAGTAGVYSPEHHLQVIARASLLLRVATGAAARHLRESGFDQATMEFWWQPFGENRGFWENGGEPVGLVDLWADIEGAIADSTAWFGGAGPDPSLARWRANQARSVSTLAECERIGLWGLGM